MKYIPLLTIAFLTTAASFPPSASTQDNDEIFHSIGNLLSFTGGQQDMDHLIRPDVQQPDSAIFQGAEGKVDVMPQFPGGDSVLKLYLQNKLVYPEMCRKKRIEGKVFVSFVVMQDGSIEHVKVLRQCHFALDAEAVRVVESMPKWSPGMVDGKPVRVRLIVPVKFSLR